MPAAITPNLLNVLDPAMAEIFLDGFISDELLNYMNLFRVLPSTTRTIEKIGMDPPGTYAAPVAEGNDIATSPISERYKKTYTMATVELGYEVSKEGVLFLSRAFKGEFVGQLGVAAARKLNSDGFAVLSGGFSDTGPDGVALFATTHPSNVGNQSNTGTTALGYAGLEGAITNLRRQKTPTGELCSAVPRWLVVSPENAVLAQMLVSSPYATHYGTGATSVSGGFQTNVIGSLGIGVLIAPDLTDANDWFLCCAMEGCRLRQYIAKGPSPREFLDQRSESWVVQDWMSYATGYDSWRNMFGSAVS